MLMKTLTLIYINASLPLLHEIESAYVREWEILKLPGKITGFLYVEKIKSKRKEVIT